MYIFNNCSGHDGSMCNADQYGSMCDQILSIDDFYWETLVSMLRIWSHIDPYWSALHIDPSCPDCYFQQHLPKNKTLEVCSYDVLR